MKSSSVLSIIWKFIKGIGKYIVALFTSIAAGFTIFAGGKTSLPIVSFQSKKYKVGLFYILLPLLSIVIIGVIIAIVIIAATGQFDAYFVQLMNICIPVGFILLVAGIALYFLNDKSDRENMSGEFGLNAILVNSGTLFVGGIIAKLIYINRESLAYACSMLVGTILLICFIFMMFSGSGSSTASSFSSGSDQAYRNQKSNDKRNAQIDKEIERAEKRINANSKHTTTGDNSLAAELSRDEYKRRVKEDQIRIEKLRKQKR